MSGFVTDLVGWRVIFWAYPPLLALLALVSLRMVPEDRDSDPSVSLSLPGSVLCTAAVRTFVVGATLVSSRGAEWLGGSLLGLSLVVAAALVAVDRRAKGPLLPVGVLGITTLRQGSLAAALNTMTTSSVVTLLTLYLHDARGRTPMGAAASWCRSASR